MKRFFQILLAIAFGILMLVLYNEFDLEKNKAISGSYGWLMLAILMAYLYYLIFERRKKN